MKTHGLECCHGARRPRSGWPGGAAGGALFAVLAALMPKCPLCIAAWLGVLGLSGLVAHVDARALWLAASLAMAVGAAAIGHRFLGRGDTKKGDVT